MLVKAFMRGRNLGNVMSKVENRKVMEKGHKEEKVHTDGLSDEMSRRFRGAIVPEE